jgi:hypothetical protein
VDSNAGRIGPLSFGILSFRFPIEKKEDENKAEFNV